MCTVAAAPGAGHPRGPPQRANVAYAPVRRWRPGQEHNDERRRAYDKQTRRAKFLNRPGMETRVRFSYAWTKEITLEHFRAEIEGRSADHLR
jgi:hypothetical protein